MKKVTKKRKDKDHTWRSDDKLKKVREESTRRRIDEDKKQQEEEVMKIRIYEEKNLWKEI